MALFKTINGTDRGPRAPKTLGLCPQDLINDLLQQIDCKFEPQLGAGDPDTVQTVAQALTPTDQAQVDSITGSVIEGRAGFFRR